MKTTQNKPGKRHACRFIAALVALAAFSPLHAETDIYGNEVFTYTEDGVTKTYKFWVSGTKAEIATSSNSNPAVSAGTALATATRSGRSTASSLEARFRTWLESLGTALKSTSPCGFFIKFW